MKYKLPVKNVVNEDGFALVASMMMLLILCVIGISGTSTSNMEHMIAANDKGIKVDFYNQETCLATSKFQFRDWLTTKFLTDGETVSFFPDAIVTDVNANNIEDLSECTDVDGNIVGSYKVRKLEATGTAIAGWEDLPDGDDGTNHPANNAPLVEHLDKPDPGSGYDQANFEIRRFSITVYSPDVDRNTILQEGTFKVFNKF